MRIIKRFFFPRICLCLLLCSITDLIPKASAASEMTASEACIAYIKEVEGFSAQPYYDYNQYTVGYGTKCPSEKYFDYKANGIPKKEAEELLRNTVESIASDIHKKLMDQYHLSFSQHQFDALVSFSFNLGTGWMTYDSSLRNAILNNADDNELVYAFGLYCTAGGKYLPGLITRRLCEANMYLNGIYSQKISDAYGYVYYDANGGTLTYRVQGFLCDNGTVPVADAIRTGDVFLGWYTELTGGSHVSVLDRSVRGKTLFARWQSSENTDEQTATSTTVRVTGDVVNVRSGPSTNYSVLKKVYQNDVLTVSYVTNLTSMVWGKIESGWICLDYTNYKDVINGTADSDEEESNTPQDNQQADNNTSTEAPNYITGIVKVNDALRIRSGPGTNYTTIGFLFNGKEIDILEQETVGSVVWGRISKGWVCMDYVITNEPYIEDTIEPEPEYKEETVPDETQEAPKEEQGEQSEAEEQPEPDTEESSDTSNSSESNEPAVIPGTIKADALRIRSGPSTSNPIVGFYYQNESVVVLEKRLVDSVYWGRTNKGWINMDYVIPDMPAPESEDPSYNTRKTVIGDCLRIRKEPGTDQKIVGFLYYGDTVQILDTKMIEDSVWGRIDKGWIAMDYVH